MINELRDDEIEAMAARLEAAVRVEDARFRLESEFQTTNALSTRLIANRAYFLRIAALVMRAAIARESVSSAPVPHFQNQHNEQFFNTLERRKQWQEEPSTPKDVSV